MVAVAAFGALACGGDSGGGKGGANGPGGNQSGICEDEDSAEYQACSDAMIECIFTEGGACKAETDEYMQCSDADCFRDKGKIYTDCIRAECPDAVPCMDCE